MKLSKTHGSILFVTLVSVAMTAVMSFGILMLKMGWRDDFFKIWFPDFLVGCCLAIPTGFIVVPLIKKAVDSITV